MNSQIDHPKQTNPRQLKILHHPIIGTPPDRDIYNNADVKLAAYPFSLRQWKPKSEAEHPKKWCILGPNPKKRLFRKSFLVKINSFLANEKREEENNTDPESLFFSLYVVKTWKPNMFFNWMRGWIQNLIGYKFLLGNSKSSGKIVPNSWTSFVRKLKDPIGKTN